MTLNPIDLAIFVVYVLGLIAVAFYVSREKAGHDKNTDDYFLAGHSLPWWAIGASLIAANISAEQIIGMSGSGYVLGLAIASYEWMAAITLIIVGKYFLPIFLKRKIYTMPQFLEQRFDSRVKTTMAIFWLAVYVFVNLTAVLWLGALAINTLTGLDLTYCMILLAALSLTYSLYGGLKAVAFTDIIQVVLLIAGGLFLSYMSLNLIGDGQGIIAGFDRLSSELPEKFDMILTPDSPHYVNLPGLSVLVGGMWIMNLSYWGFNQYIIQRTLAAKDLAEAQKGIAFAAFLKLLMPVIVVLPGIAAVLILPDLAKPDQAYPELMNLMPVGLKGLIFAALVAAILSSLASMTNSVATIFTMDLYKPRRPDCTQGHYVKVGRIVSLVALIVALVTAQPLLGKFDQAFQYIQEFTGFFTPGIVVLFLLGMFWKKTTANAALAATIGSAAISLAFKMIMPEVPFMDRVGLVFISCMALAILVTLVEKPEEHKNAVDLNDVDFKTQSNFNISALLVTLILIALYTTWW
ncbi:sodium/sugar symporter [Psychrosphaera sp. B3R10]|uniref:sodium/sugar symporter n=1 Tax=unclassified Psychrosphaera TaxID=2641570 RepID=UPI001C09CF1D|nr:MULTISPECIES: sodium/sugar symporter [unclassified Psychrosphaera]MBU2880722.1 sodium/sugar symporter [Psychrosphaera sp. I2R16]MBU2991532.1 sodium/sugar symporter [Psychrosphaera sp. B3R10]